MLANNVSKIQMPYTISAVLQHNGIILQYIYRMVHRIHCKPVPYISPDLIHQTCRMYNGAAYSVATGREPLEPLCCSLRYKRYQKKPEPGHTWTSRSPKLLHCSSTINAPPVTGMAPSLAKGATDPNILLVI